MKPFAIFTAGGLTGATITLVIVGVALWWWLGCTGWSFC